MQWTALREAAQVGDFGRVIHLAREAAGVSQRQLGDACGMSQSAVSRLESHGAAAYDMNKLARAATHLQLPLHLVGLAEQAAAHAPLTDGPDVQRRNFLAGAAAVATAPALSTLTTGQAQAAEGGPAAALRLATTAYRRLDGSTPSRQLVEPVLAHLRLAQTVARETTERAQRAQLAAVGSEAASLAGWLSWDMGDYGSARTWYGTAVRAARTAGDKLLTAYQVGSLAQFEAHAGNAAQGLAQARAARRHLGSEPPAVASAWLSTIEALAHAGSGDSHATDRALHDATGAAHRIAADNPPPWPWVFPFTHSKVAAARLACGARLGRAQWVFDAQDEAAPVLSSGHEKQRALYVLDLATAHLSEGRLEGAFALATNAVETGARYRSGRIVERARALRRSYTSATPPKVVRDFDDRLYGIYL